MLPPHGLHKRRGKKQYWENIHCKIRWKSFFPLLLLIDAAPCGCYHAVVPVALPGPTELYLSQVNKSFWHYKIFKGGGDQARPG